MTKIAVIQVNPTPGDFTRNAEKILEALNKIPSMETWTENDWIVFPMGSLSGFPLEDLRFNSGFVHAYKQAWDKLSVKLPSTKANMVFRHPGSSIQNRVLEYGRTKTDGANDYKILIETNPISYNINPNGMVYREFQKFCIERGKPGVFCNLSGGQDSIVFEGGSFVCNAHGQIIAQAKRWEEDVLVCDLDDTPIKELNQLPETEEEINELHLFNVYNALKTGIRDYVEKNGFEGVIIGLSGGIDSALTATLAADALGSSRVTGVTMPSKFTSGDTLSDAEKLAKKLGVKIFTIPLELPYNAFNDVLEPVLNHFDAARDPQNLTDQNLQARIRAIYLMALSNRTGRIVLNTSNKSEGAVGYGTLYGDLAGGLAVLIDLWKTEVWELSRWINKNAGKEIIPESTINRIPSAELRENQEDRHSIPDYPVLDPMMKLFVEQEKTLEEIVAAGFNRSAVELALKLYNRNEFKRRQCAPGLFLTARPLAQKSRPLTSKFTE